MCMVQTTRFDAKVEGTHSSGITCLQRLILQNCVLEKSMLFKFLGLLGNVLFRWGLKEF